MDRSEIVNLGLAVSVTDYPTTDLAMAAYLSCAGFSFTLKSVQDRQGQSRGVWVFPDDRDNLFLKGAVEEFEWGNGLVEPLQFTKALSRLRKQLYKEVLNINPKTTPQPKTAHG